MLILGIVLTTIGFIIAYKGAFAYGLDVFSSGFMFISYILISFFDNHYLKLLSFLLLLIIYSFFHFSLKSLFTGAKGIFIIFNIKIDDLLEILEQLITDRGLHFQATGRSIIIDAVEQQCIRIKWKPFNLALLSLSEITDADLLTYIEENLDASLSRISRRSVPILGISMLLIGIFLIIRFYAAII